MYRVLVTQCEKPHNITGRKRYRVALCYFVHDHKEFNEVSFLDQLNIASSKRYRRGTFINPTKVVKKYLLDRKNGQ